MNLLDSTKSNILERRLRRYNIQPEVVDAINDALLYPNIDGFVTVRLGPFEDAQALSDAVNFIREHYVPRGWEFLGYEIPGDEPKPRYVKVALK